MYSFNSRIRYSETDIENYLTFESLIDYFQDCSTFQTQEGPATIEEMAKKGTAWVLNSWQVVVNRLPGLGERVVTGTVPYELNGFFGLRNFYMDTEDGERLAVANSVWTLINMEKGTPVRIDDDIIATYPLDEKLPMDYASRKIRPVEGAEIFKAPSKIIGMHHLDSNLHVNNGQYIRIALQAFDYVAEKNDLDKLRKLAKSREKIQIRAEYRQQAHLGDEVQPVVYVGEDSYLTYINDDAGKPYAIIEIKGL
ncbi:Acyl-ACP thioesterase [Butyrivibrio sp. ob235]|uniref:acyl-[acyl-carrier-protein] thioesterase n=1 Tax=unclassified Butyrivibrio TaxID=2639466 RepID=UPI0003B501DB|nr:MULTISPECIES: acyl-ACP thioesterase domain-containing protein [unclassified Butyrivibrio]SEK80935.1 Acyl-ACP thioesterase [Butyrivibrio sp. ob235]